MKKIILILILFICGKTFSQVMPYKQWQQSNKIQTTNWRTGFNDSKLDAEGNLIGILSDGNNETISNIYHYNERFQRTIALDIRYMLFILEHYAGTKRVIEKLNLVDE